VAAGRAQAPVFNPALTAAASSVSILALAMSMVNMNGTFVRPTAPRRPLNLRADDRLAGQRGVKPQGDFRDGSAALVGHGDSDENLPRITPRFPGKHPPPQPRQRGALYLRLEARVASVAAQHPFDL